MVSRKKAPTAPMLLSIFCILVLVAWQQDQRVTHAAFVVVAPTASTARTPHSLVVSSLKNGSRPRWARSRNVFFRQFDDHELSSTSLTLSSRTTATRIVEPPLLEKEDGDDDVEISGSSFSSDQEVEVVPRTMREALQVFFLGPYNGPRAVVAVLAGLVAYRSVLNGSSAAPLSMMDGAVAVTAVVVWWIQEHILHQHALHSPFDWYGKQIHQGHHDKPYFHVSIDPAHLMLGWLFAVFGFLYVLSPTAALAVSATLGYSAAGLFYEFAHFIVHTKVRFRKHGYWQKLKDHHIRHHNVDSQYWLAFSLRQIDTLFGTDPDVRDVRRRLQLEKRRNSD